MSTEPLPGPDPDDDELPGRRWLVPAMIGLSIGVLFGGAGVFIIMSLASRSRANELAVEKFDIKTVLDSTASSESLSGSATIEYLGPYGSRPNSGSAVYRRITLNGTIAPTTNVSSLGNTLKNQIDAEMARHGAMLSGGGSSSTSGSDSYSMDWQSGYYTRDGRRGHLDGTIEITRNQLKGIIIICEGR